MAATFRSLDGRWLVMPVEWDRGRRATMLWVLRDQTLVARCRTLAEVAAHVPLHLLVEHDESHR